MVRESLTSYVLFLQIFMYESIRVTMVEAMSCGVPVIGSDSGEIPHVIGDAGLATKLADRLLKEGIYVIGFSYPVVPEGKARIRVMISASHSQADLDQGLDAFEKVGRKLGVIG